MKREKGRNRWCLGPFRVQRGLRNAMADICHITRMQIAVSPRIQMASDFTAARRTAGRASARNGTCGIAIFMCFAILLAGGCKKDALDGEFQFSSSMPVVEGAHIVPSCATAYINGVEDFTNVLNIRLDSDRLFGPTFGQWSPFRTHTWHIDANAEHGQPEVCYTFDPMPLFDITAPRPNDSVSSVTVKWEASTVQNTASVLSVYAKLPLDTAGPASHSRRFPGVRRIVPDVGTYTLSAEEMAVFPRNCILEIDVERTAVDTLRAGTKAYRFSRSTVACTQCWYSGGH